MNKKEDKKEDKKNVKDAINLIDNARIAHKEKKKEDEKEKENNDIEIDKIVNEAKKKGKITYGELASQLSDASSDQIDQVFNAFENIGVDVLKDDIEDIEPDAEDLEEVEDIPIEELNIDNIQEI